jgi:3-oxoadipate enol-lactonase
MPMTDVGDCLLNVSADGPVNGPASMLSNSMGRTIEMWEPQVKEFAQRFRVIRYDRRGHGTSGVPSAHYSVEQLGLDVHHLKPARMRWCGISIEGMVGQWLGARAPERLDRIILSNTSCYFPDPSDWLDRIEAVHTKGVASIAKTVILCWFTAGFRARQPQMVAAMQAMSTAPPREGCIDCCETLGTLDQRALLPRNSRPTPVIAGRPDKSTPLQQANYS